MKRMTPKIRDFWAKMAKFFSETERVGFRHNNEFEADTVLRQLEKVVRGDPDAVCDTGWDNLPLFDFDEQWRKISAYLRQNDHRSRREVLRELKAVAMKSGGDETSDFAFSESCETLLPY